MDANDKKSILLALDLKFGSNNPGLVDSIKYVLYNYDAIENSKELLRGLVFVDFGNDSLVLEDISGLLTESPTVRE